MHICVRTSTVHIPVSLAPLPWNKESWAHSPSTTCCTNTTSQPPTSPFQMPSLLPLHKGVHPSGPLLPVWSSRLPCGGCYHNRHTTHGTSHGSAPAPRVSLFLPEPDWGAHPGGLRAGVSPKGNHVRTRERVAPAPGMTSLRWPVPAHLKTLPALRVSDFNFAPSSRSLQCPVPRQPKSSAVAPSAAQSTTLPADSRGGVSTLFWSPFLAPGRRPHTPRLPQNQEDSGAPVSCPPACTSHWSFWEPPLREPEIRDLDNAQPQRPGHI